MNRIFTGLLVGAVSLGMWSCASDDNPWSGSASEGGLHLNLLTDGSVSTGTRAADNQTSIVPEASQFAIDLTKSDNSLKKHWNSVDDFNKEDGFPMGAYLLEASFGEEGREGFGAAWFYGSENVTVRPQEETSATITASLANAMVSIRYTENFTKNFRAYSAAARSEGHDAVVFSQFEERPAYITPSNVEVHLTMTNMAGQTVTINPANFEAEAKHHYIITINAVGGGDYADLTLDVQFEEEVVAETIEVNLGDALFTAPAPEIKAAGFNVDENDSREIFENDVIPGDPRFEIYAFGGLKSVKLSYDGPNALPFNELELIGAEDTNQAILRDVGLNVSGLFKNPDKMAVIGLTDFVTKLGEGTHTLTLQVTDARTMMTEPMTFKVTVNGISYSIERVGDVGAKYINGKVELTLKANNARVKDGVKFYANDGTGDKEITDYTVTENTAARAAQDVEYHYTLTMPDGLADAPVDIKANYGIKSAALEFVKYSVDVDAFAKFAWFRVNTKNDSDRAAIMAALEFAGLPDGTAISKTRTDGIIEVTGFTPATDFEGVTVATPGQFDTFALPKFTTEATIDVPNGDFDNNSQTIYIEKMDLGGKFGIKFVVTSWSQLVGGINCETPDDWANINGKTCYEYSSYQNTWYLVPSTMSQNGQVVIRSVGYSHNGSTIPQSGTTVNTYYCTNTPADSDLSKAAGELFLGSYSFNGQEIRNDKKDWTSRPSNLKFHYMYSSMNGEKGEVCVKFYDSSDKVISEAIESLPAKDSMTEYNIDLLKYSFGSKASKITLCFRSVESGKVPSIHIPTGSELHEPKINSGNYLRNIPTIENDYHALATGSVLTIDNVHFGYEAPAAAPQAVNRKKSNRK